MSFRRSVLWLVGAFVLLALAQGRFSFGPALWLAPIAVIRFTRTASPWFAFVGFVAAHTVALELAFLGMVPLPWFAHVGLFTGISLVLWLPLLLDRVLARRYAGAWTTLVAPAGWVAFDYASGVLSPNGSWGSLGYGLADQVVVAQLASVTGWTGLTFLVTWFGAIVNWVWDARVAGRRSMRGLVVSGLVFVSVFVFGVVRLVVPSSAAPTIRAALLAAPDTFQGEFLEDVWAYTRGVEQSDASKGNARSQIAAWQDRHFTMIDRAIADGAELVVWAEVNAACTAEEAPQWIDRARAVARREGVWLGLGLAVFRPQTRQPTQNRFVLIDPSGELAWDHQKATRVPGSHHAVGDGILPRADTDHGVWTGAICFDMDFPRLLHQAGRMPADVLIAPSNDWTEVRHTHARMAVVRAIEQGFHLVRPTKDGISLVADNRGRVLARIDTDRDSGGIVLADVPTRGTTTVYGELGDLFSWLCAAFFVASASQVLRGRQ